MAGRIRAAAVSSSTNRPTSEGSRRTKRRPIISKMTTTFLLIFFALLLIGDYAAGADEMQVMFRNKLPEDVTVYWEGADRRIPQGDPIPAGGEHKLATFPGHKFTYDVGGERHWVQIRAGRDLEVLEIPQREKSAGSKPEPAAVDSRRAVVEGVKTKLQQKIQDVRDHPVVDKTASALAKTAQAIDEVSHKAMESEAGKVTRDLYAKASEGAGSAAHKLADRVAPSASAKYVSESSHSLIGGFIMIFFGGIAALSVCSSYFKRRRTSGVRKEKADLDLDYKGSDIEGGAVFNDDNGERGQPFQLYHSFEYTMRHRYQGTSYSYASAESPPPQDRDPQARRMPRRQSIEQTNAHTYRQNSVGPNDEPILVISKYKDRQSRKGGIGKSSRRRLLATAIGLAGVGYVGVTYFMPTDMSFSELWLFVAEFVDAKLGHHGLVL